MFGGEHVLERMLAANNAVAYMHNGSQFIRLVQHIWSDTTQLGQCTELGGKSKGKDALGAGTLESLTEFF